MSRRLILLLVLLGGLGVASAGIWAWHGRQGQALDQARQALAAGEPALAEKRVREVLRQQRSNSEAQLLLVQALRKQGRYTDAEEALQRAMALGMSEDQGR